MMSMKEKVKKRVMFFIEMENKQTLTFKKRLTPLRFLIEQKVQITINRVTKIGL